MIRPAKVFDPLFYEKDLWQKGIKYVAGVDEAGRGPWAGPVVAGAVILPESFWLEGLRDSKTLCPRKREEFCRIIKEKALSYSEGVVEPDEIDNGNILQATFKAMRNAIEKLPVRPQFLLVDGPHRIPGIDVPQIPLVRGDSLSLSVSAAGVLAKVTRDEIMKRLNERFPEYGFRRHKGYGTEEHRIRLNRFGPTELHRFSFSPVEKSRHRLGKAGEARAVKFLRAKGYKVLERNFRTRVGEVDILAEDNGVVAFVEVKTRSSDKFGRGEEAVSLLKQRRLIKLAFQIMKNRGFSDRDFRFDVLSIHCDKNKAWRMELIKSAFEAQGG